jgi:hypothetical protein
MKQRGVSGSSGIDSMHSERVMEQCVYIGYSNAHSVSVPRAAEQCVQSGTETAAIPDPQPINCPIIVPECLAG